MTDTKSDIAEAERDLAEAREALERQADNMAFVLNNVTLPDQWYEKFQRELVKDRLAALRVRGKQ